MAIDFIDLIKSAINDYQTTIANVKPQPKHTWQNSIQPLEEAAESLDKIWNSLEHVNAVENTPAIRGIYDQLLPLVTDFHTDIMQDAGLYQVYLEVKTSSGFSSLDIAQQTIVLNEIRDFSLSGVSLEPAQREKFKQLSQRLSELENDFSNNVLDATEAWDYQIPSDKPELLAGLPEHIVELAKVKPLGLDQPTYYAVMAYAVDRGLREKFYTAYNTRAPQNTDLISEILQLRQQLAAMVGFSNYAEYSLASKMAGSVAQVTNFLQDLAQKTQPIAAQEFAELCDFARQKDNLAQLEAWDIAYYSEALKLTKYNFSEEELRVYFPVPKVLSGLFNLAHSLYGVTIQKISDTMFTITDQNNNVRGHFYIDLYTRDGKRGGAWVSECTSRLRFASGVLQKPEAYLVCNFAPSTHDQPALLTHDEVITLFHEFGHTLHHVLTQVDYYSASGFNGVAWDAVELPSQFMENWCWQWDVLQDISAHETTGEPLPKAEYDKLLATKNFHSAMRLIRQLEMSMFDFDVHANTDPKVSAQDILDSVRNKWAVIPIPKFNRFQNSFCHIFAGGYAAGYYGYLWAEVLSCDAFAKFNTANQQVGFKFLTNILEQGGSRPAMELFIAFAGREPEVDALLRHHAIT